MKYLFLLLICVCCCLFGYARPVIVYDDDNLSCNRIISLEQDAYGFIWIATEDGLNKFDGYTFTNYFHDESDSTSIACNYINKVYSDSHQRLWVASNKGIQYYLPQQNAFRTIKLPVNSNPNVTAITELHNGDIWIAASGSGLYSINSHTDQAEQLTWIGEHCDYLYVNCIYEDTKHYVWISYLGNQLARISLERKEIVTYTLPQTPFPKVYGMKEDAQGNLYLITYNDVLMKTPEKESFQSVRTADNRNVVARGITQTSDGKLWVNTVNNGLMFIDTKQKQLYPERVSGNTFDELTYGEIVCFLEDTDGNKWLAYRRKGLVMVPNEGKLFESLSLTVSPTQGSPTMIYQSCDNHLWVGNWDGSLQQLDRGGKRLKQYNLSHYPRTVYEKEGTLWIGSNDGGIYQLNLHTDKLYQTSLFVNKSVNRIIEGRDHMLYLSCPGNGLGVYNPTNGESTLISYQTPMENQVTLGNDWINDLLCDKDSLIWIAHFLGVRCYDTSKNIFLDLPINHDLKNYVCYELLEDKDGRLWIGTNNGIYIYDKQKQTLQHIGKKEGMPSNVVCGLEKDTQGNIWCSTYKGICRIEQESHRVTTYYSGNGLRDKEYIIGMSLQDNNGYIYFGGPSDIIRFIPDSIQFGKPLHIPVLTNLYVDNVLVNASKSALCKKKLADTLSVYTNELYFDPKSNTYSFEFSTFNFHNRKNTYFKYRLRELDGNWSHTLFGENRITYNYLPPGQYTLEVQACENNISSPIRNISIYIASPWYLTSWALVIYFVGAVMLILGSINLYIRQQNHKRRDEINEEKIRFFINIAHEIRSPLTLIINPLNELLKKSTDSGMLKILRMMEHNTNRIMSLINQLLDIRRIDQGQMKIKCRETDLISFIDDIYEIFSYQAIKRNINFTFNHTSEKLFVWIDVKNFDKIIINLLSNAFKYTPDGGEIEIVLTAKEELKTNSPLRKYAEICVRDTGKGLDKKEMEKVFERFYQSPSDPNRSLGFGIGLNLAKMLVELHHGTIKADNRSDKQGSCFTIQIPLGNDFLSAEEREVEVVETSPIHNIPMEEWVVDAESAASNKKSKYRILLVDDDRALCEYLQDKLGDIYRITTCHNGQEALQVAMSQTFDLVISDIVMPIMDGFELLHRIKRTPQIGYLPVILLTSQTELENRIKGYKEKADAFLSKPFNIDELMMLCANLIENRILIKSRYNILEKDIKSINIKANDELFLERLIKVINENLSNVDFTVENLADEVGISRVQLHRKLKDLIGVSTSEFIRNLRLQQATILLKDNKVNISQIAYAVGFSNPILFSSTFKKTYGCTPREYRERNM